MRLTHPSRLIVADLVACGALTFAVGFVTSLVLAGAVLLLAGH